mmetsp:Transcript_114462/g.244153  ORF Transcript_114462/g.244153 Transcript_114462/m.244153 type:complete len:161 (+) Transcript_114462:557-1039(+)
MGVLARTPAGVDNGGAAHAAAVVAAAARAGGRGGGGTPASGAIRSTRERRAGKRSAGKRAESGNPLSVVELTKSTAAGRKVRLRPGDNNKDLVGRNERSRPGDAIKGRERGIRAMLAPTTELSQEAARSDSPIDPLLRLALLILARGVSLSGPEAAEIFS